MLLHVEVLHKRIVDAVDRLGPNADLVRLADEAVAVFISRYISLSIRTMRIDAHVIGNAEMVVSQGLIHAVDGFFGALAPVSQAEILARVAMEMVFFPLVGIHVLIRVVEVFALERSRLLETIGRDGEIQSQQCQYQQDTDGSHHSSEIKPEAFMLFLLHGKTIIFAKIMEKWQSRLAIRKNSGIFAVG